MLVDIVDEKNRPIGRAERATLLHAHLNFRTVHILFWDAQERLLLQQLPPNHARHPGRLGSSVAGYLQSGETYFAAARRKEREELHLATRLRHLGVLEMRDEASRKFVGVFLGALMSTPVPDYEHIAE